LKAVALLITKGWFKEWKHSFCSCRWGLDNQNFAGTRSPGRRPFTSYSWLS